ncbi:MAG: Trm112 family protein [Nitrosopumilus sp. B06]|nr:MAG: Trm112 family protein [Nitrosopumilus sp. D6]RNJ80600.1 MAG: Trm112 family protein [Nitrosopumilus sp. B06]
MNKSMMKILACPMDKTHPLELFEVSFDTDSVSEGALYCVKCARFYMITEGIPVMLPDELRDKKHEMEFLKKNSSKLPEKITSSAAPWHL